MIPLPRAVVATLAVLLVAGCASGTDAADPPARQVEWTAMAESPLGSRGGVLSAWTGEELLILGGSTSRPCPPGAGDVARRSRLPRRRLPQLGRTFRDGRGVLPEIWGNR